MAELTVLIGFLALLTAVAPVCHIGFTMPLMVTGLAVAALLIYILGGFKVGNAPPASYRALARAPFYVIWKVVVVVIGKLGGKNEGWVRTARGNELQSATTTSGVNRP